MTKELAIRCTGGETIVLSEINPRGEVVIDRDEAEIRFDALTKRIGDLQSLCYAAADRAVLIVLQGMDTSGKDGTISHVLEHVNPMGAVVTPFKVPTPIELSHDYLWRIHQATPAKGMLGVFNRSHYESVLVERVKHLVPEAVWRARYAQINAFESLLVSEGTVILKFYLHISREEQEERLLAREEDPEKAWKLSAGDWIERRSWDDYIAAYQDAITNCSTPVAPWYIVPADRKWYRNLAVASAIVAALEPLADGWRQALAARGAIAEAEVMAARAQIGVTPPRP